VWDGSYLRLYVNGVLDASVTTGKGPTSGTSSLKLGRNSGGNYFSGLIDEVRVSNAALYNSNFTPQTHLTAGANTKGLWKFDGQSSNDASSNGNNGTLQGGASYSDDVPSGDGGGGSGGGTPAQTWWLVSDHLGTPRMIFDQTGALANMKRHDYLPFGEELFAPTGGRTTAMGYSGGDDVRQQFTSKERDIETGLDYFLARYYASTQGRFTSPDDFWKDSQIGDPQSWNKYGYVRNNPLRYIDPSGEKATVRIETDEEKKKGTIKITASIAIYTNDENISKEALAKASADIKSSIEKAWKGQYEQNGITFDVSTEITVTVQGSESEATKSGAQNVIELSNGKATNDLDSYVSQRSPLGGPDRGKWNINNLSRDAGHEFGHLMGVDNHEGEGFFMDTHPNHRPANATAYDYGWAFGGAINSHRLNSRPYVPRGRSWETLNAGAPGRGAVRSHTSTRELRAALIWWR
jgi:RHS repeat-associated protein